MARESSDGFFSPPLNYKDLSHEDALEVINGFYPSPELPPSQHLRQTPLLPKAEAPELPTATDDEFATLMSDIEAMAGLESMDQFQAQPEDAPTNLEPLEVDRPVPSPFMGATPPNSSDAVTQPHKFDPPALPMDLSHRATPARAVREGVALPSSSNRSELQAEMRHEETDPSSPLRSMPAPVPFSLSKAKSGVNDIKRAASSSPLATRQPLPKKAKNALEAVSSPLMLFGSLPASPSPSAQLRSASEDSVQPPDLHPSAHAKIEERERSSSPQQNDVEISDQATSQPGKVNNASRRSVSTAATATIEPRRTRSNLSTTAEESADIADNAQAEVASRSKSKSSSDVRSKGAQRAKSVPESTELQIPADTKVSGPLAKSAARYRPPMGANELKELMGTNALAGLHAGNSPQRLTRHQRIERAASQPGVSTKEAVKRRRQNSKK